MRRISTNLTSGQISFILLILLVSNALFFYLGLKYGGRLVSQTDREVSQEGLLPSDRIVQEVREILSQRKSAFKFHGVLSEKQDIHLMDRVENLPQMDLAELMEKYSKLPEKKTEVKNVTVASTTNDAQSNQNLKTAPVPEKIVQTTTTSLPAAKESVVSTQIKTDEPQKVVTNATPDPVQKNESQTSKTKLNQTDKLETKSVALSKEDPSIKQEIKSLSAELDTEEAPVIKEIASKSGVSKYRLQVGSFSNRNDAIKALADWRKRGYSVKIVSSNVPGKGKWYRLQVGGYESIDAVSQAQKKLMQEFGEPSVVSSSP